MEEGLEGFGRIPTIWHRTYVPSTRPFHIPASKNTFIPPVALYPHSGKSIPANSFPMHDGTYLPNCQSQFLINIALQHIKG